MERVIQVDFKGEVTLQKVDRCMGWRRGWSFWESILGEFPLSFHREVVSKDGGVSPHGSLCVPELVQSRVAMCPHRQLSRGRKCQALPLPTLPIPGYQPRGMSPHVSLTVEMLQQGSDVKLRLFSTRWPDLVKIRTWHENLGK